METNHTQDIRFFGDSLTAGYGVPPGKDWISELSKRHPDIKCFNHGLCGAYLEDITDSAEFILSGVENNSRLFFMGGTNDILSGFKLKSVEDQLEKIIRLFGDRFSLFIGIPPLTTKLSIITGWQEECNFERNNKDLKEYGKFLKSICSSSHIPYIDFSESFPPTDSWYTDGLHPNEKGYLRFADCAEPVLYKQFFENSYIH